MYTSLSSNRHVFLRHLATCTCTKIPLISDVLPSCEDVAILAIGVVIVVERVHVLSYVMNASNSIDRQEMRIE